MPKLLCSRKAAPELTLARDSRHRFVAMMSLSQLGRLWSDCLKEIRVAPHIRCSTSMITWKSKNITFKAHRHPWGRHLRPSQDRREHENQSLRPTTTGREQNSLRLASLPTLVAPPPFPQVYEKNAEISGGEGTMISLFPNGLWALSCSHPGLPETVTHLTLPSPFDHPLCVRTGSRAYSVSTNLVVGTGRPSPTTGSGGVPHPPQLSKFGNVDPTCPNYSPEGKLLGKWELAERMSASYGYPMIAICWSTVLKALQALLPADCIHTGHQLMGLEEVGGGVMSNKARDKKASESRPCSSFGGC